MVHAYTLVISQSGNQQPFTERRVRRPNGSWTLLKQLPGK